MNEWFAKNVSRNVHVRRLQCVAKFDNCPSYFYRLLGFDNGFLK